MAPGWDEHKAELERLYLSGHPAKTIEQIRVVMETTHGFKRSAKSYERQFKFWGFRKNMKSSISRDIHHVIKTRKSSGKESRVIFRGSLLDLENPKIKRKITRNAPLPSATYFHNSQHHSGTLVAVEEAPYIHTPPAESSISACLLKGLPWFGFLNLLPFEARSYPDLAVIASQMAVQSKHDASTPGSVVQGSLASSTVLSASILSILPQRIRFPGQKSFAQYTRDCHEYLSAILIPESHEVSTTWKETSSGTIQLINGKSTPYFSLLVYLASNNFLEHAALDSMLDYAENLIIRGQFKSVFSTREPTILALLDTLLASAVRTRNLTVIEAALSADASPDVHIKYTPVISWAAKRRDTEVIGLLLDGGANPHATDYHMETALVIAAENGCVEAVKLLLDAGTSKAQAEAALGFAICGGETELCRMILDANTGLDVNEPVIFIEDSDNDNHMSCLYAAVISGDIELVKMLTPFSANINLPAEEEYEMTVLEGAVSIGNVAIIKHLLSLGADFHLQAAEFSKTDVPHALQENSEELFIFLLQAGADINVLASAFGGRTALQFAASYSGISLIKLLLDAGAEINAPAAPWGGMTALQAAAMKGRREVVELLLNHDADVNAPAAEVAGMTALQAATQRGDIAMVQLFLNHGADILAPASKGGVSALESAIAYDEFDLETTLHPYPNTPIFPVVEGAWSRRDFPFAQKVMGLSVDIDVHYLCRMNVLAAAAKRSRSTNIDLVELLLDAGVAVDSRESIFSPTALHLAVLHHDFPVVETLLKAGADIHLLWDRQSIIQTALNDRWDHNRLILDAWGLIEKGVDFNSIYSKFHLLEFQNVGKTHSDLRRSCQQLLRAMGDEITAESNKRARAALAVAAARWWRDSAKLVQRFLDAGLDPNTGDERDLSPLQMAAQLGSTSLVQTLLRAGADVNAPLYRISALQAASKGNNIELIQLLLDKGANVNAPAGQWGCGTALQAAINADCVNLETVRLLLDSGADINAPADQSLGSRTALQAAISYKNNFELIQLLLKNGADVNAPAGPRRGATALQAAAINGYVGLAAHLIDRGAEVNAPGSPYEGRTALEGAAEWGRLDMVKLLLDNHAGYNSSGAPSYESALSFAKENGNMVVHNIIKAHFDERECNAGWDAKSTLFDMSILEWDMGNGGWVWND